MATIIARNALGLPDALQEAARISEEMLHCAGSPCDDPEYRYSQYVSLVHALIASLRRAELAGATPEALRAASLEARLVHRLSPLCERLQDWPRGYAGDFETVEYLCDGINQASVDSFGHAIEAYALRSAAAQQHRNKVQEQAAMVARRLEATTRPIRVLSIGCGGSRDLLALRRHCADPSAMARLSVVLNDADEGALALSAPRLGDMGIAARTLPMNVLAGVRLLVRERERFDLVLAGGLFDYLDDRTAAFLVRMCGTTLLGRGGSLFFTNIAAGNPYRTWMDHIASWRLIHRSEDDIRALVPDAPTAWQTSMARDVSGLAILTTVTAA